MASIRRPEATEAPEADAPPAAWLARRARSYRLVATDPAEPAVYRTSAATRAKALADWSRMTPDEQRRCHEAERRRQSR